MMKLSTMKKVVDTLTQDWKSPLADQIIENWHHDLHMFMKLHALYAYPRILRSLDYEIKEDSPDWIKGLTGKLTNYAAGLRKSIGMLR